MSYPAPRLPAGARWFYVSLPEPGATFLVGVVEGRVAAGPPYLKRQLGRDWPDLANAWRRGAGRRGRVRIVPVGSVTSVTLAGHTR